MQKILVFFVLIFSLIPCALSAAFYGFYGDADHPGKCVLNDLILSPGEVYNNIESCSKTSCEKNSMLYFLSCGVYAPPPNCKLGDRKHPDAYYPDCCEHHVICNTISN